MINHDTQHAIAGAANILETIGKTPLIRLNRSVAHLAPQMYAKVESFNPGGSTKDRVALRMIEEAEKAGLLRPGGTVIEATAGNTGLGLALVKSLAQMHGGVAMIESVLGEGTSVTVRLPHAAVDSKGDRVTSGKILPFKAVS